MGIKNRGWLLLLGVLCWCGGCGEEELREVRIEVLCPVDNSSVRGLSCDGKSYLVLKLTPNKDAGVSSISISSKEGWGKVVEQDDKEGGGELTDSNPQKRGGSYYYNIYSTVELPEGLDNRAVAQVEFDVVVRGKKGKNIAQKIDIQTIREPVVFIHGLNSSADTFTPMVEYFKKSELYLPSALYSADYFETSTSTFEKNSTVVPSAIDHIFTELRKQGFICKKASIVGHSMGGLLARLYLQSESYEKNIGHLITICTPHQGSPIADYSIEYGIKLLNDIFDTGAISDLQATSIAIKQLNDNKRPQTTVPTHVIAARVMSKKSLKSSIIKGVIDGIGSFFGVEKYTEQANQMFDDITSSSDIIVPLNSQLGGICANCATILESEWHTSVHSSPQCMQKVLELLSNPHIHTTKFSTKGFSDTKSL